MNERNVEVENGERFQFGKNWQAFLRILDDQRIIQAENSIKKYLQTDSLGGLTFLDIGSGSGLFSLAARRLGAKVHSFDYDLQSVQCTKELKRRFFDNDDNWVIEQGSILERSFFSRLGNFDIVYSWGVLHHTGDMWQALDNVVSLVKDDGYLFISLYNHQVYWSAIYKSIKRSYVKSPRIGKFLIAGVFIAFQSTKGLLKDLLFFRNPSRRYSEKKKSRGMSMWYDWIDWIGGYPFEISKPEDIVNFYYQRGFSLQKLATCGGGHGCNEFVFIKSLTRTETN